MCMYNFDGENFLSIKNTFKENETVRSKLLYGKRINDCQMSIVIPTYLRNLFLERTINSALNQNTNIKYEVIVVDNDSDFDHTATLELIKNIPSERLSYYKNEKNLGMFGNWNRCLELANSQWVLILHDDDTIDKNYISEMMQVIVRQPNLGCLGCLLNIIDENNVVVEEEKKHSPNKFLSLLKKRAYSEVRVEDFYFSHPINIMGLLVNRKKAIEIGGFDSRWHPTSDFIFILNMAYRYRAGLCHKKLLNYRIAVNASMSFQHIVGMVEVDAIMRRDINKRIHVLDPRLDRKYRNYYANYMEHYCLEKWAENLDKFERRKVVNEYKKFNKKMEFTTPPPVAFRCFKIFDKGYRFYCKYLRKNRPQIHKNSAKL